MVDCGHHSIKYGAITHRHRKDAQNTPKTLSRAVATCDPVTALEWSSTIPTLLANEVGEDEHLVLFLLLDTLTAQPQKEALLSACFEQMEAAKVCLGYTATTALFAAGETSGVVLDVGYASARITPVVRGIPELTLSSELSSLGAHAVDDALRAAFREAGEPTTSDTFLTAVKSQCCWVGSGEKPDTVDEVALPDGSILPMALSSTALEAASSRLLTSTRASATNSLLHTWEKATLLHPDVSQWVRCGGAAGMAGVGPTVADVVSKAGMVSGPPRELHVRDHATASVEGGVILTHLNTFKKMCIDSTDYEEEGPQRCLHQRITDWR